MTTINTSSPLASYLASASKLSSTTSSSEEQSTSGDSLEELRRFASELVANNQGGLMRALSGSTASSSQSQLSLLGGSSSARISLPDVADMDRDEAARMLEQVDKLIDSGLGDSLNFSGFNDSEQTDSLSTYRDWLQEKGGISVYA